MKKLILIFAMSVVILGTVPAERNDTVQYNKGAGVWWDTTMWANVKTDTDWILKLIFYYFISHNRLLSVRIRTLYYFCLATVLYKRYMIYHIGLTPLNYFKPLV